MRVNFERGTESGLFLTKTNVNSGQQKCGFYDPSLPHGGPYDPDERFLDAEYDDYEDFEFDERYDREDPCKGCQLCSLDFQLFLRLSANNNWLSKMGTAISFSVFWPGSLPLPGKIQTFI